MLVTVAVCTWNRAHLLDATLAEMRKLEVPAGVDWELLLVDNGCTDDTDQVIARRRIGLPLRLIHEPTQGQSYARNRAIDEARGELILWTDDDVLVTPGWLVAYAAAARRYPEASFFGGPVEPWFAIEPPSAIADNLTIFAGAYALRSRACVSIALTTADELPFGANFAVRRTEFKIDRFDPTLGRTGNDFRGGEEVGLLQGLLGRGQTGIWVEAARVRHFIPRERLTRQYLWRHYHGRGRIRAQRLADQTSWAAAVRRYCKAQLKLWWASPRHDERWARAFKASAISRGIIDELRAARPGLRAREPAIPRLLRRQRVSVCGTPRSGHRCPDGSE